MRNADTMRCGCFPQLLLLLLEDDVDGVEEGALLLLVEVGVADVEVAVSPVRRKETVI